MLKKILLSILMICILLFLLLNPAEAFDASKAGLLLWFETLLPTLLPFLILTSLLMEFHLIHGLTFFLEPFFCRVLHLSQNGCFAVLTGFLCGYPMGAKITADLVQKNSISKKEGQYLLSFCNNASPMFFISFVMTSTLNCSRLLLPSLVCLYLPPLLLALILQPFYKKSLKTGVLYPGEHTTKKVSKFQFDMKIVDTCIMNGFEAITKLGGYIILFSILSRMTALLFSHIPSAQYVLTGFMEITNGIGMLADSPFPFTTTYVLALSFTAFGGFSGAAQTKSMIQNTRLSVCNYMLCKSAVMGITALFAWSFCRCLS